MTPSNPIMLDAEVEHVDSAIEAVLRNLGVNDVWSAGHPDFTVDDWQIEVADGDTRQGYWVWVARKILEQSVPLDQGDDDDERKPDSGDDPEAH